MSWLRFFRKDRDEAGPAPGAAGRPKSDPGSGYGTNPYDTYTWELHLDPNGERQLKRAHVVDRPKDKDGETFNPYDTGKFSGGW